MRQGLIFLSIMAALWLPCVGMAAAQSVDLAYGSNARIPMPSATHGSTPVAAKTNERLMTLEEAIMLALRYNTDVQSAELQRITDKWSLKDAYYEFEPQFSVSGSTNKYVGTGSTGITSQNQLSPQVNLESPIGTQVNLQQNFQSYGGVNAPATTVSITQPLLQGASYDIVTSGLADAKDQEIVNKLTLKNQVITTVVAVIQAYRTLQQSLYSVQTSQLALKNDAETLKQDQVLIKAGRQAPSTLVEAQSQLASDKFGFEQAQNQVAQNKLNLLNAIGLDPETGFKVPQTVAIKKVELPTLQEAESIAFKNNIAYQEDLINLRVQRRAVQQAIDQGRWQLDFEVSSTRQKTQAINVLTTPSNTNNSGSSSGSSTNPINNNLPSGLTIPATVQSNTSWGFTLNIPIDDIGLKSSIVSAKVSYRQQLLAFEQSRRQLITKLMNDIQTLNSDYEQLLQAQLALQLQQKNLDNTNKQLIYGVVSTFQVNQTVSNLITARSNLISSQITYANDLTNFSQDLGTTLDDWHIKVRY